MNHFLVFDDKNDALRIIFTSWSNSSTFEWIIAVLWITLTQELSLITLNLSMGKVICFLYTDSWTMVSIYYYQHIATAKFRQFLNNRIALITFVPSFVCLEFSSKVCQRTWIWIWIGAVSVATLVKWSNWETKNYLGVRLCFVISFM